MEWGWVATEWAPVKLVKNQTVEHPETKQNVSSKYTGKNRRHEIWGKCRIWKGPRDCWPSCFFSPRILPFTLIPLTWESHLRKGTTIYLSHESMCLSLLLSLVDPWFCLLVLHFQIFLLRVFLKVKQNFRISGVFRADRRVIQAATSICRLRFSTEPSVMCVNPAPRNRELTLASADHLRRIISTVS